MKSAAPYSDSSSSPEPFASSYAMASIGVAAAVVIWIGHSQSSPFATYDVLAVHLLATMPVAVLLAATAARHWKSTAGRALGGLLLSGGALLIWFSLREFEIGSQWPPSVFSFALRTTIAISVVTGAALGAAQLWSRLLPRRSEFLVGKWTVMLSAIVLPLATYTYETARCRHDRTRLTELLEQSRLGDARTVAQRLLTLQPEAVFRGKSLQGKPLAEVARELQQAIDQLELRVQKPIPQNATSAVKLARARDLAMLGRNSVALDVLATVPDLTTSPSACNLCGTIAETEQAWDEAAQWYGRARDLGQANVGTAGPSPELARATMGLAFCQRKQGDLAGAEQSYLELLSLSPTADTYFLLATFYEDTQQVTKAQRCARRAMALAPDRYQAEGQRLIDKLITLHFGCLQAFAAAEEE